jgi:hypothetical protein
MTILITRITADEYDKKLQELKDKQYRLNVEMDEYTKADHEYHIHVNTVINLSRRIADIFESSEPMEKRAILGFILQNPTVSGKKLEFTMRKPFDAVLELATCPTGLPIQIPLKPRRKTSSLRSMLLKLFYQI